MERYWFKAKRYGYGWYPATWEGWATVLVWFAAVMRLVLLFEAQLPVEGASAAAWFVPLVIVVTGALVFVAWLKGEPARWRWGDDK